MKIRNERIIFHYLSLTDNPELDSPPDMIAGFGHFDPSIPARCADLYSRYEVPVLFTGGRGAGTADLDKPEALAFQDVFFRLMPETPREKIFVEPFSTNTTENIRFSLEMLEKSQGSGFLSGLKSLSLVASPYRQRRVFLTCRKHLPSTLLLNHPPRSSFEQEWVKFATKGLDLSLLMRGELERLESYADNGWIERTVIPEEVRAAARDPG